RRRRTRSKRDWSSDVCSSDLGWKKFFYTRGDVLDGEAVAALVNGADVVVHLAFIIMGKAEESRAVNLDGSRNVFQAAKEAGAKRSEERRVGKEGREGRGA